MKEWSFYFPEDGETATDAVPIVERFISHPQTAAYEAGYYDFHDRDGWERGEEQFPVVVIDPDGVEHRFICWHEPSVEHRARRASDGE